MRFHNLKDTQSFKNQKTNRNYKSNYHIHIIGSQRLKKQVTTIFSSSHSLLNSCLNTKLKK